MKFVGPSTDVGEIQDQAFADITGYIRENGEYDQVIIFVFDAGHKLKDATSFKTALLRKKEISDVIVVQGF